MPQAPTTRNRAPFQSNNAKGKKKKMQRLWRNDTRILRLSKAKTMLNILDECSVIESLPFPSTINHVITHFLCGAYSFQICFWGHKYSLRVAGYKTMTLGLCLHMLTTGYGITQGVPEKAKSRVKKENLLFLQDCYESHNAFIVETRHEILRYAPREKRIGQFEQILLKGVTDWQNKAREATSLRLGYYKTTPKW